METITGPIPGENFTSDTKNYPWHRPPEYDDLDEAIEYASKKLTSPDTSLSMLTLMKNEVPVSTLAEIFLMQGISRGKWTIDYALLMAGPIAHIIKLMAKSSGIKFDMGIDDDPPSYTDGYFKVMKELDSEEETAGVMMGEVLGMGNDIGIVDGEMNGLQEDSTQASPMGGFVGAAMTENAESTDIEEIPGDPIGTMEGTI